MASDDDFYDSDDYYGESDTGTVSDFETEESDDDIACHDEKNYTILKEEDIIKRQNDDIATISSILSLSREESHTLLSRYNWNVNNVHEEWFADEERVRIKVGLLVKQKDVKIQNAKKMLCRICFGKYTLKQMKSAACGHVFCRRCWETYVRTSINDGPGCLLLRCPEPECSVAIGKDMIDILVSDEEKVKYQRFVMRSYVEQSRNIKWCPAPDCESAIEYVVHGGSFDVTCSCSYNFCWNCKEEAHRPVDCGTVAKWIFKNKDEGENAGWIVANTKPCPKCKQSIEKNRGCMHMTCTPPCNFEFCWLCLGPWKQHNASTGGFMSCNKYEEAKREGLVDQESQRRKNAKESSDRYIHYYERWAANESSRKQARADLRVMQTEYLGRLSDIHHQTEAELNFIVEAWLQIIECRRVLKWTYAYGYYLPEHNNSTKKQFFEYLQGESESNLERLHQCAEKEVKIYLDRGSAAKDFGDLRTKLVDLTIVTRNFFDNLVRALQNDLADVDSVAASSETERAKAEKESETCSHNDIQKKISL